LVRRGQAGRVEAVMMYGDTSRTGVPFSKDPHVVNLLLHIIHYMFILSCFTVCDNPAIVDNMGRKYGNFFEI
jgi:hypothetical protein